MTDDIAPGEAAAELAGLLYTNDEVDGITRTKRGKGFSYALPDGTLITDKKERARIEALAIPPAWTDVWISPAADGHILATGRDAKGRKQYRYHPEWDRVRSETKYGSLVDFVGALPDLRKQLDADLRKRGMPRRKVLALVIRLLDESLIRVGNEAYAAENESYGLTTMLDDHVDVTSTRIVFDFTAKGGLDQNVVVRDRQLAAIIKQCSELGGHDLFTYQEGDEISNVSSTDVNDYLHEVVGSDVTAKHFRTWGGTVTAAEALAALSPPESERQADSEVLAAFDFAADRLGNTRAVCRASYVHPAIPEAYRSGDLAAMWPKVRRTKYLDRPERLVQRILTR